jgi:hypothetical protein
LLSRALEKKEKTIKTEKAVKVKSAYTYVNPDKPADKLTSTDIVRALYYRHRDDVATSELSINNALQRVDFWTMKRSHAHPEVCAYEIKVSRQDWEQDHKYLDYQSACNRLFVACPWGLIAPGEAPAGVGVIWVSGKGHCSMKRQADYKQQDLTQVYRRVLMRLDDPLADMFDDERRYRQWLDQKETLQRLGRNVGVRIQKKLKAEREELELEKSTLVRARHAMEFLEGLGVNPQLLKARAHTTYLSDMQKQIIEEQLLKDLLPEVTKALDLVRQTGNAISALSTIERTQASLRQLETQLAEVKKNLTVKKEAPHEV